MIPCKNCKNQYTGNYCNTCGQEDFTPPFSVKEFVMKDIKDEIIGFDKGFVYTVRKFLFSPGESSFNFIHGQRVGFIGPFAFIVIAVAFTELLDKYSHYKDYFPKVEGHENAVSKFLNVLANDWKWLTLMLIPIVSWIASKVFKKEKLAYGDHFLFTIYSMSMFNIISIGCLIPLIFIKSQTLFNILSTIGMALGSLYFIIMLYQFFRKRNPESNQVLSKSIMTGLLSGVAIIVVFVVLSVLENLL